MSFARKKVVIDSNILVSAAIYPNSASANALRLAVMFCELYRSDETTAEIEQVLLRTKFDRYFAAGGPSREDFLTIYKDAAALEPITEIATDCSDPKDNKFLSLALSVKADFYAPLPWHSDCFGSGFCAVDVERFSVKRCCQELNLLCF
jgi:uncharacterized protein